MGLFGPDTDKLKAQYDTDGLVKLLQSRREKVREAASIALSELGAEAVEPVMRNASMIGQPAEVTLTLIGEPAVGPVTQAVWAGETRLMTTLTMLAAVEAPRAYKAVCDVAVSHPSETARVAGQLYVEEVLGNDRGTGVFGRNLEDLQRVLELPSESAPNPGNVAAVIQPILRNALQREIDMGSSAGISLDTPDWLPSSSILREDWRFEEWAFRIGVAQGLLAGAEECCRGAGFFGLRDVLGLMTIRLWVRDMEARWRLSGASRWLIEEGDFPEGATEVWPDPNQPALIFTRALLRAKVGMS